MLIAQIVAQETGSTLPTGRGVVYWLIGASVIFALWWMIRGTRKRAYDDYFKRRKAEQERRLNDPDMARPDEES